MTFLSERNQAQSSQIFYPEIIASLQIGSQRHSKNINMMQSAFSLSYTRRINTGEQKYYSMKGSKVAQ